MTLPFYPFYWGDYTSKTLDLTQAEHGAYFMLLCYVYCTGKRIPHERRYTITNTTLPEDKQTCDRILHKYFKRRGGFWFNPRAEEIMKEQHDRHQAFVDAGKKGGRPPKASLKPPLKASLKPGLSNQNHNQYKIKNKSLEEERKGDMAGTIPLDENDPRFKTLEAERKKKLGKGYQRTTVRINGYPCNGWYFTLEEIQSQEKAA